MRTRARGTTARVVVAGTLFALVLTGCGSSQPSSAVEDDTSQPTATVAVASPGPSASAAVASPASSEPAATPVAIKGPPPKPGNPTFKLVKETPGAGGTATVEYKITWTEPKGVADSFLVFGLPDCLRYSKAFDNKACVARGMRIPADKLVQIGVAPGDQRERQQHLHDRPLGRRVLQVRVLTTGRAGDRTPSR